MRTCMGVVLVVLATQAASAQTVLPEAGLTEAEALSRLSAESPRVRALRAQVDVARADIAAARRFPNPRVTLSREAVAGIAEDYVTVAQPLPVTGRRALEALAAEAGVRATEFRVGDVERRARAELRNAFATLRRQQTREEELTVTVRDLRELADVLAKRELAGDAAGFDRLRAEREVLELEADLVQAQAARTQAQGALAAFFAPTTDPLRLRVATTPMTAKALPAAEELLVRAEASRGELLALAQDVEAAGFARRAAARRVVPEPEIVAGLKTSNAGSGDRGTVVSVLATIPLFDRSRPEQARAEARRRQASAELEVRRMQLRASVIALRDIVERRRAFAEAYRTAAIGRSDDLKRIARVSYEAGERGILELLDAYRSASVARARLADLDALVAESEIELEYVTGWENVR
jgi:cobalt-zinc-cadmium efflux system outer membrane protein